MESQKIQDLIANSLCYVAFVQCTWLQEHRDRLSHGRAQVQASSLFFETFGVAFFEAITDFNQNLTTDDPRRVRGISFSDSLYLSAKNLPSLLRFLESVFAQTYLFQQNTYCTDGDNWIPFIRAGVVQGWVVNFRDFSMCPLADRSEFRNPVGPAVAHAYLLTEIRGKLPGMRCYLERKLLDSTSATRHERPGHYRLVVDSWTLYLLDVPQGDASESTLDLVEVAWPCHVIASDNCSFYKPIMAARRQFEDSRAIKQYNGTVKLIDRSVPLASDSVAQRAWSEHAGLGILLPTGEGANGKTV